MGPFIKKWHTVYFYFLELREERVEEDEQFEEPEERFERRE